MMRLLKYIISAIAAVSGEIPKAVICLLAWVNMHLTRRAQLRARRELFENRTPVELDQWASTHGLDLAAHPSWITTFLTSIGGEYGIDPRKILPSDRLGHELGYPSRLLNRLNHQDGLFQALILNLNDEFLDVWSLPIFAKHEDDLSVQEILVWLAQHFPLTQTRRVPS